MWGRGQEVRLQRTKRGFRGGGGGGGGGLGLPIADLEQLDIAQESAPPWPEVERWSRIPLAEIPARSSPFLH